MDTQLTQDKINCLTPKPRKVLDLLVYGKSDREISEILSTSQATVRKHIQNLCDHFSIDKIKDGAKINRREELVECINQADYSPSGKIKDIFHEKYLATSSELSSDDTNTNAKNDIGFIGRSKEIKDLHEIIQSSDSKMILIQAEGGAGKTTLARKFMYEECDVARIIEFSMATASGSIASAESVLEEWLIRHFDERPCKEFSLSLERLRCKLKSSGKPVGIFIDNIEAALDIHGKFVDCFRNYADLLRVLCDPYSNSITLIASRERVYEPNLKLDIYPLRSLDLAAWHTFFQNHKISLSKPNLSCVHEFYNGNATAMRMVRSIVAADFKNDLNSYWDQYKKDSLPEESVMSLVREQFDRLCSLDKTAYNLLCRMSCYRYQDISSVPYDGTLKMLWDVNDRTEKKRAIRSLVDRSFLEVKDISSYSLHPVIRLEAKKRLVSNNENDDWFESNRNAAEFWTELVQEIEDSDDAKKALEAYYHYESIKEFREAGQVLAYRRDHKYITKYGGGETLGRSLIRLGLLRKLDETAKKSVQDISSSPKSVDDYLILCRLYNLLGWSAWVTGNVKASISFHDKCSSMASMAQNSISPDLNLTKKLWSMRYEIYSLFSLGLCKMKLRHYEEAIKLFEQSEALIADFPSQNTDGSKIDDSDPDVTLFESDVSILRSCIVYMKIKRQDNVSQKDVRKVLKNLEPYGGDTWHLGYQPFVMGNIFRLIGDYEESKKSYEKSLSLSNSMNYPLIEAQSTNGLALLYRDHGDMEQAIKLHRCAINIFSNLNARLDLAEAYLEAELTFQKAKMFDDSEASRKEAKIIFKELEIDIEPFLNLPNVSKKNPLTRDFPNQVTEGTLESDSVTAYSMLTKV